MTLPIALVCVKREFVKSIITYWIDYKMIISTTQKFIFIHIPKNAGTFIKKHLKQYHTVPFNFKGICKVVSNEDKTKDLCHLNYPFAAYPAYRQDKKARK